MTGTHPPKTAHPWNFTGIGHPWRARYRSVKLLGLFFLVGFTLWAFFPILQSTFTNWDEEKEILKNPVVLDFSWNSIVTAFTSFQSNQYMPFPRITYSALHALFGFEPFFFQLNDLVLHIICVLMVFQFLHRLTRDLRVSLIAAVLFGIHPLQVQSVAWTIELRNLLYSIFFFGAASAYVRFGRCGNSVSYGMTALFMIFSLLSKSLAITLPAVFLLCDYRLGRPLTLDRLREKWPFFLLSGIFVVIALHAVSAPLAKDPLSERILLASYSTLFYFPKLLLPVNLCCIYPFPDKLDGAYSVLVQVSPVLLGLLTLAVLASTVISRKLFFGFFYYLVNIAPVSRFIMTGARLIAQDHFIYVPVAGIFLATAEAFHWAIRRAGPWLRMALWAGLLVILLSLSLTTRERIKVWENSVTLFEDVLSKYPNDQLPYNQLGLHYLAQGDSQAALTYFTLMEQRFPNEGRPLWMQAKVHLFTGNIPTALAALKKAEALSGPIPEILIPRGTAHLLSREYSQAIETFNAVLQNSPKEASAYLNRAWAHYFSGDSRRAVLDASLALSIAPDPAGRIARAIFALFSGEPFGAISDLTIAQISAGVLFPEYLKKAGQNFMAFGGWDAAGGWLRFFPFDRCPGVRHWTPRFRHSDGVL